MPFTGSHPAAVLPLLRLGLPASALVIGSVTPDLPYYVDLPVTSAQTHSLTGVLGADLILGICAYLLWHLLLVPPLIWVAPAGLQRRIPDHLRTGPRLSTAGDLARVGLALTIGALTHVLWDAFTHADRLGPRVLRGWTRSSTGCRCTGGCTLPARSSGLPALCGSWSAGGATRPRSAPSPPSDQPSDGAWRWRCSGGPDGHRPIAAAHVLAPGRVGRQMLLIDTLIEFLSTLALGIICAAVVWHVVNSVRTDRRMGSGAGPGHHGALPSWGERQKLGLILRSVTCPGTAGQRKFRALTAGGRNGDQVA